MNDEILIKLLMLQFQIEWRCGDMAQILPRDWVFDKFYFRIHEVVLDAIGTPPEGTLHYSKCVDSCVELCSGIHGFSRDPWRHKFHQAVQNAPSEAGAAQFLRWARKNWQPRKFKPVRDPVAA